MRLAAILILACAPGSISAQVTGTAAKPRDTSPTRSVTARKSESPLPSSRAPASKTAFSGSTLSGVYTVAQAKEGRDLYLGFCASCHAAVSHTGPGFRKKWAGRPLSDLFGFMRTAMPKNDPASLDDGQYIVLLAYMLQMNKMPTGPTPLSPDAADLAKIRIDTARTVKRKSAG